MIIKPRLIVPPGGGELIHLNSQFENIYKVVCRDPFGRVKWIEENPNLVVTEGRNELLDRLVQSVPANVTWYLGLKGAGAFAAGDSMSSHAGWSEVTTYDEAARQAYTNDGAASSGSTSNSGSPAVFTISGTVTIAGIFMTSDNTKGGSTGTLFGGADFSASRDAQDNDTLTVTVTLSITSS